jgi:hypothetical protein
MGDRAGGAKREQQGWTEFRRALQQRAESFRMLINWKIIAILHIYMVNAFCINYYIVWFFFQLIINQRINGRQTAITRGSRRYVQLASLPSYFVSRSSWIKNSMSTNAMHCPLAFCNVYIYTITICTQKEK